MTVDEAIAIAETVLDGEGLNDELKLSELISAVLI